MEHVYVLNEQIFNLVPDAPLFVRQQVDSNPETAHADFDEAVAEVKRMLADAGVNVEGTLNVLSPGVTGQPDTHHTMTWPGPDGVIHAIVDLSPEVINYN